MFARALPAADFSDGKSDREAIDGFSAIAAALDGGLVATKRNRGKSIDALAIGLGWLVLAMVIIFPALQLVGIAICAIHMCMRSFSRHILGTAVARGASRILPHNEQSSLALQFAMRHVETDVSPIAIGNLTSPT